MPGGAVEVRNEKVFRFVQTTLECGGHTERFHTHAYVELERATRFRTLKTKLQDQELNFKSVSVGAEHQRRCIAYCSKENTRVGGGEYVWEFGAAAGDQQRKFHEAVKDRSTPWMELWEEFPKNMLHTQKRAREMREELRPDKDYITSLSVFYGPTGVGKTYWAMMLHPGAYHLALPDRGKQL